jgi:predicted glycoside hydrolase/deacetylase ChbG (UPF0249 family)
MAALFRSGKVMKRLIWMFLLLGSVAFAQQRDALILEKLGFPPDAKLLIIHADDIGMAHSVNVASFEALEKGWVSSGSIMAPCPWFNEAAELARQHPELDLGLHLTLTSEWRNYRWGPVSRQSEPTLLDADGYFARDTNGFGERVKPSEAADEIAAQVAKAKQADIKFTHLDNHMGALSQSAGLFSAYVKLGQSAGVPVSISEGEVKGYGAVVSGLQHLPMPTGIRTASERQLLQAYVEAFSRLRPGVYIMVVHLGHDDAELRAIMGNDAGGAIGRQRDYDLVSSPAFRKALSQNGIKLTGWRDLGRAMRPAAGGR